MKQINRVFILAFALFFLSCEKDDVCLDDMDIRVNLGFYDSQTKKSEKIELDSIVGLGNKSLKKDFSDNQILLPLKIDANNTTFVIYKDSYVDTLYFKYKTEKQFVSKPCGFRVIFRDISCNLNQNPNIILQVKVSKKDVLDEKEHINAYFDSLL